MAGLSTTGFIGALEKEIAIQALMENRNFENREYTFDEIDVDVNGVRPTAGIYYLSDGKVTDATLCVDGYTVTYKNKKTTTGGTCTAENMKLTSTLKISANSVFLTYPAEDSIQITENKSGGELTCSSSDSNVATCEMDGNNVVIKSGTTVGQATITVTSHGGSKYNDASAAILVSTEAGLLSVTANGYSGVYDGNAHGISVSSSGAIIKYGTEEGIYDLDASPTYIDAGTYTVYYEITKPGYNTVTGSRTITIEKAPGEIELESTSGTVSYGEEKEINVTSTGHLSASVSDTSVVSAEIVNEKLVLTGLNVGTTSVTVTSALTNNYTEARTTYNVSVVKANNVLVLSSNTGSVIYPNDISFEVTQNPSGGTLNCSSSNTSAATCLVNGSTITVTAGTQAASSVIITVTSAATSNYNAGQAAYIVTSENGLMSVTANNYSGVYDGEAHGISVSSSGATIKYGTSSGTYDLDASPTYTDVGTYTVYYEVTKPGYTTVTGSRTVTISKANGSVTAPTAKTLTYNGSAQELINAGSSSTGTIEYKLDDGSYSTSIPTATSDGTYTVYYRVVGDKNHNDVAESSISVTINKATINYTANGYSGTYDGEAHGISVIASGATIKYGTSSGTYDLDESPTYTDVGTYTVYYQITRTGYTTVTGSKIVTITKANGSVTLSENSGTITYPDSTTFTVTKNTSGGTLGCTSSNPSAATCSISNNTVTVYSGTQEASSVTITVTSAETNNYNASQAAYVVTSKNGVLSVTANNYSGTYDGKAHGISVSSSGATIKYGTSSGTYDLDESPTYTDVGTYTVYYQITRTGYTTVKGSKTVTITKANGSVTLSATSGTVTYPDSTTFTVTKNTSGGALSCSSSNPSAATCSISNNIVTVYPGTTAASSVTITVTSEETNNYNKATATYTATSKNGVLSVTANNYSGTYDGKAHGISVSSSGATIKYGTKSGTYNLTASPTYTDVGTYTVYYQVTKAGYTTVKGSKTVTITKANGNVTLSATSGSVTHSSGTTFTVTKNTSGGTLSCSSSNTSAATCSVSNNTVTVTAGTQTDDSVTITVTSAATSNYNQASATYTVKIGVRIIDGVVYYDTKWIGANPVYYNPVTGKKCNISDTNENYHTDNSKTGYNGVRTSQTTSNQTKCLKWYAYSEQNGNVNLLLDHNTTANLGWKIEDCGTNSGPGTASNELLGKLKSDTSEWIGISNRNDSYSMKIESKSIDYTINYSGYKARIITIQEVANIVGKMSWDNIVFDSSNIYFLFDSHTTNSSPTCSSGDTSGCSYGWLNDRTSTSCTNQGCLNNSDGFTYGYWTASAGELSSSNAWSVGDHGIPRARYDPVCNHYDFGLRPIITVPKSNLSLN
ncbi:MAG: hypothetical protein J6D28_00490 [Bacilli bacterium]|nr:hypothetical protein [Bacilli bacterium]